jgi:hypothetical protein
MTSSIQADVQLGYVKESGYGTPGTVSSFVEPIEEDLAWSPTFSQGAGLRVGNRAPRADRRALVKQEVGGSFTLDVLTKGLGKLIEAAMTSAGVSTSIAGSAYQQNFTITSTDYLNSYTIQKGVPLLGGGALSPHTFNGMVCSGFEFTQPNGDLPTIKFNWSGKGYDTSTSLASPSYIASTTVQSFTGASLTVGGSVTAATTTALATGGTAAANVREFSLKFDNNLDTNGFNLGGGGSRSRQPAVGLRTITGSMTAEWDATTFRDIFLNQTDTAIVYTLLGSTAISGSDYPALQFHIPLARFEGEIPKSNAGDVITQSIDFTVLDNGTLSPLIVSIVTAETAI